MHRVVIRLALVAVFAALAAPAHAQLLGQRLWHIGVGGGVSVPAGDLKDATKNGVHGQGFLEYGLPHTPFSGRISLGYQKFNAKTDPAVTYPTGTGPGTASILSGVANLSYGINLGLVQPYLTAGLGAFDMTASPDGASSSSKTHFGINGGAGVKMRLGQIQGFVEGRYENLYTDNGFSSGVANAKNFAAQIIPITFGVEF